MTRLLKGYRAAFLASLTAAGLMSAGLTLCSAQTPATTLPDASTAAPDTPSASSATSPSAPTQPSAAPEATTPTAAPAEPLALSDSAPARKIYTVPAGTKVLLELRSAINTKSAKAGDGVYLSSTFPVVVGSRVMIPNGVYVQGVVDRVQRGGMMVD